LLLIVIQSVTVKSRNLFGEKSRDCSFYGPGKAIFFAIILKRAVYTFAQQNYLVFLSCHPPHFPCKTLDSFTGSLDMRVLPSTAATAALLVTGSGLLGADWSYDPKSDPTTGEKAFGALRTAVFVQER